MRRWVNTQIPFFCLAVVEVLSNYCPTIVELLTSKALFGGSRTVNSMNVSAIGNGSCTRCSSPTAYAPSTGMSRCIEADLGFVPNADLLGVTACPAGQFRVFTPILASFKDFSLI